MNAAVKIEIISSVINIRTNKKTGDVRVDVPEPEGGIVSPTENKPGEVVPPMSKEQRAYNCFWSNGTKERINELLKGKSSDGSNVLDMLRWLVRMRIDETARNVPGFRYAMAMFEE